MSPRGRLLVVALVVALAARSHPVAACDSCSSPGGMLAAPTGTCQTLSGSTDSSCRMDVYAVDLTAGDTVVFTLCDWSCPTAGASFNAVLGIRDPSCSLLGQVDDSCGLLPEIMVYVPSTGRYLVELGGSTSSDVGSYTLGWYKSCWDADCWAPTGDLGPITTSCQLLTGSVACVANAYSVTLVQGQSYTFTLCGATCPGADAVFDAALELYDPTGSLVASSSTGCADDGEIVYAADPTSGGGTYCVRVAAESGGGRFALGYRVACQAPGALALSPLVGRATQPACSEVERFTITGSGTPAFAATWTITPPPGGSAAPPSGAFGMTANAGSFESTLSGRGIYVVAVALENECGRMTQSFDYALRDRAAPDLALSATAGCGPPPPDHARVRASGPGAADAEGPALRVGEEALATARNKAQAVDGLREPLRMERLPGLRRPPQAAALDCPTPCDSGSIEADQAMYDVFLSCEDGSFTARTGASHPVTTTSGAPQNVIFGGAGGGPGTSDVAWFVHGVGELYQNPWGTRACVFDPPDTAAEPDSIGIEAEWTVEPVPGLTLTLREEIVAFGTDESNSGVRLTLGATNEASSTGSAIMGVRWQIDYQNADDDGPLFATVSCNPPEIGMTLDVEHELAPDEILDFYRIQNNTGTPIFSNFTNTTAIAGFPGTGTPDRLVFGYWPSMVSGWWDRVTDEGSVSVDYDSAVHYWFGHDAADGISIAPGEELSRSVVIFTSGENVDCSGFTPGDARNAEVVVCEGDCARLEAVATDGCSMASVTLVDSTPGAPPCSGNPCDVTFPATGTWQYTWEATDADGNATRATATVSVRNPSECFTGDCSASGVAPSPDRRICQGERTTLDASGLGLTGCPGAVGHEWSDGTRVVGTGPVLSVQPLATTTYTVTVRCDADPTCATSASVRVQVDRLPVAGAVTVRDLATCSLGLEVTWEPAQFFNGGGVYNLYRSEASCSDAMRQAPLATGLTVRRWIDGTTREGIAYFYVVEAEDDPAGTTCRPLGADHGGPADAACSAATSDAWDGTLQPEPTWASLRVRHRGQEVTADWTRARSLAPGEHFHLLKTAGASDGRFEHVNGEGVTVRTHVETDTSSPLQFFDLRVADACENVSRKEYPIYPPGYDLPR